jgi:UPF0716 family protein affecting phage T7 exclusion
MTAADETRILILPRIRPVTLLLFAASWIIFEWLLFGMIARQIGTFAAVAFYIVKGGLGLLLLGLAVRRVGTGLSRAMRRGRVADSAGELFGAVAGAILITLPGLIPTLIGLALFAPSVRRWAGRFFIRRQEAGTASRRKSAPGEVELDPEEWRSDRH